MSERNRVLVHHMGHWVPATIIPDPDAPSHPHPKIDVRLDRPDSCGRDVVYGKQFARGVIPGSLRWLEA